MFLIYPDVVFGKGGYASFPALFAARVLGIPVIIHESDSVPGKVNLWASKFAKKIAISYSEAVEYFPKEKTALTGQPIRSNIVERAKDGTFEYLKLDPTIPVIFVWGGSLGAVAINDVIIDALPELLNRYQIIHQVGPKNLTEIENRIAVALEKNEYKDRYKLFGYLNTLAVKMSAGAASLIITRAGSSLFEIASWGVPSIVVPIPEAVSHDQKHNAFNYARSGACSVIEENNLTPSILVAEIDRIIGDKEKWETMSKSALAFAHPGAAEQIAKELIAIALKHEK
jgi:UDP-N-acetylglucosamine--N-acetylmuramyl-(pentapeptide) pyrophosphoryl-undecaprenol N-acetylglucosamine transferase